MAPSQSQSDLQQALSDRDRRITSLETQLKNLTNRLSALEEYKEKFHSATFDPTGDRSYQRIDSNVGTFLVVLENAEPYLDGQKVSLLIGNPNNVTYSGVKLDVGWHTRIPASTLIEPEASKAWDKFFKSGQQKEINLTDSLRPGAWNKVNFTIAPAKAEEFGSLQIGLTVNQVQMAGGK